MRLVLSLRAVSYPGGVARGVQRAYRSSLVSAFFSHRPHPQSRVVPSSKLEASD